MKTKLIALIAVLASALTASAINYTHSVVLNRTNGNSTEFKFDDCPVVFIEDEEVKIQVVESGETLSLPMAEIKNFTFTKAVAGIDEVADDAHITFGITREAVEVNGLEQGVRVAIYDINGMLRLSATADDSGRATLATGDLGTGVYIVTAGNQSFKFIR